MKCILNTADELGYLFRTTWHTGSGVLGNCQLQWPAVAFDSAVLSAKHGPASEVWLCRSWQGDDGHCSSHAVPVNSPGLLLPEPERRTIERVGVMWGPNKAGRGVGDCRVSFTPSKLLEGNFPFPMSELPNTDTIHLSHGISIHQCNPVLSPVYWKHTKMFKVQGLWCPKGRLIFPASCFNS